jgi:SAM-dependent methyltransferase
MTQQLHQSDPRVLNRRTPQHDHPHLVPLLKPGMRVLDIGCGTGVITADMARAVSPGGSVIGVDRDARNLEIALQEQDGPANLAFKLGDVLAPEFAVSFEARFDLVNAARMLLWISDAHHALEQMKKVVRPGGRIVVFDYSLDETFWDPAPPRAFLDFYDAFLHWRSANGWDNAMARHLPALFAAADLVDIRSIRCDEVIQRSDSDLAGAYRSQTWLYVIESIGPAIAEAGFLNKDYCAIVREQFANYVNADLVSQCQFAVTVEGMVPE